MLFGKLFHTAIKTANLDATVRFYTEVLGMIVADRPPIGFPGAWLKPAQPGADAIIHLYAGDAAKEADGSVQTGTNAIDHVSVVCQGYSDFKARFEKFGLAYRENLVPATPLWQLFIYDPNGVQLELTFHSAAEPEAVPVIPDERRYNARERWFQPALYRQFESTTA
ncbi:VOC family protein [Variovorax sp. J22R133]|uniref:VOC family protein n=1 Tax=Variovorax brevis TaxID=3053503 RepID=UPI0025749052|nr:VOC family protein [Variovorax sp. J22R133]MDM0115224.1 VOC family protein [Variovorax sp. J22R133]